MNNSVYGKTMENVRKRCNLTIVDSEDKTLKHIAKPTFIGLTMINNNFIIIRKTKSQVKLNKPFYVGVAVWDYSKFLMYNYDYGIFKKVYGDKVQLFMTDRDSLFYEIKTDDVYKDCLGKIVNVKIILIHQILQKQIHTTQIRIRK